MKAKTTKRALLFSALAVFICISMLVGTTYAWFSDSVTSNGNVITSGTLNVDLLVKGGDTNYADYTSIKTSQDPVFNYDLWEPGYLDAAYLKVATTGDLALKFTLYIRANGEVSELADVIDVYFAEGDTAIADRADLATLTRVGTLREAVNGAITIGGNLVPGAADAEGITASGVYTLVLKMQEDAGNEYQNKSIGTDFAIKLFATQLTYEDDSIDDQYDTDANLPVIASQTITAANADDAITVEAPNTGVAVVVPADDTNEGDTYMLEVSNQSVEQNDMGETTVALDAELFKNNVKVENSTTVYDLTFDIGAGATITSVKHNDTALTAGTGDGHYEYDSATGILTIHTRSFSPFSVEFTGPAAVIGDVKYETVAAAFAAAVTGDTVKLIRNSIMPGNAGITVPAGKELTLDLNGFKFSNAVNENKASQVFMVIGTLTIKDTVGTGLLTNGIEEGTQPGEWWSTPQYNYVSNTITNCGTVIVESGKITNTAVGSICYCIDNNSTSYDVVLNIKGGLIEKDGTAVRLFCNSTVKNNTLIMEGGKIKGAYTAFWVQLPGSAGAKKLATLDISGGVIEADTYSFYDYSYGDVFDEVVYDITGGTFLSERGVYSYGVENFILGGLFEYEPDEDYIAGGYCAEQNGEGLWEVKVEESILA